MTQKPIVVVGSINLDLVAVAQKIPSIGETVIGNDFQTHPGGKGANQAVSIARLGYPVQMIGKLGSDAFGTGLRKHLQVAGVGTEAIGTFEGPSGAALIVVSSRGDNSIVVVPGANEAVSPQCLDQNIELIRNAGMVLTQLEIPLETVEHLATLCKREKVPLVLDPAPAMELPSTVFRAVEWFTPNETEAAFYAGESSQLAPTIAEERANALLKTGCRGVVLKMGSDGVYLSSPQGQDSVRAFRVKPVDTTAAGDAFNGAFAVGLMKSLSARESATFATAVAAISVTRKGAQPSMPNLEEAKQFMIEHAVELPKQIAR
ncbi:MAG: ribokinase [Acidobacteria bacterium]|nr:ribokinase [Acidobacteriota bacterium]